MLPIILSSLFFQVNLFYSSIYIFPLFNLFNLFHLNIYSLYLIYSIHISIYSFYLISLSIYLAQTGKPVSVVLGSKQRLKLFYYNSRNDPFYSGKTNRR